MSIIRGLYFPFNLIRMSNFFLLVCMPKFCSVRLQISAYLNALFLFICTSHFCLVGLPISAHSNAQFLLFCAQFFAHLCAQFLLNWTFDFCSLFVQLIFAHSDTQFLLIAFARLGGQIPAHCTTLILKYMYVAKYFSTLTVCLTIEPWDNAAAVKMYRTSWKSLPPRAVSVCARGPS